MPFAVFVTLVILASIAHTEDPDANPSRAMARCDPSLDMKMTVVFLPDSDTAGTLLFIGQGGGLGAFASWLDRCAASPGRAPVQLDAAQGFEPKQKCDVSLLLDDRSDSHAVAKRDADRWLVTWHVSPAQCRRAAALVRSLAESEGRMGHQYFEETGPVSIEVAFGDWREGVWKAGVLKMIGGD